MADPYQNFLKMIERQQGEITELSAGYEQLTKQAYAQARDDIGFRMQELIEKRGGLGGLSPRDRYRLTRDAGLIESIDGRLAELGSTHTNIVTQAFSEGGSLAVGHIGDEMTALVAHLNSVSASALPVAAVTNFAKLDTAAIELGLGTALNDVTALNQATRVTMRREITAGVAAGEGIRDLSKRVALLDDIGANRAEVITRWTTIKSYNLAHQASYEAAESMIDGLVKQWVTQTDERACPHCLGLHGTTESVTGEFDTAGTTYANTPIEPYQGILEVPPLHARCRCTIASWHESWRAYTDFTPQELHEEARQLAADQGFPKAATQGVTGVAPSTSIRSAAGQALGDMMRGIYVLDDFSGSVKIADGVDMSRARLALRDAGFRVRTVADDPRLLRIDWPQGLKLPRTIRSTKFKALSAARWDEIKKGLLACGLK
jgi:hypothetical protein